MDDNKLHELFRLDFVHTWFPDGVEGLFEMEPTEACRKNLTSYGLYFKKKEDGFVVAAPYSGEDEYGYRVVKEYRREDKFTFAVFTNDKYFAEHSGLPDDPPGEYVYYFNNQDEFKRTTTLLLDIEGVEASERLKLHTKKFVFDLAENNTVVVTDFYGGPISETEYDCSVDEIEKKFIVDLSRMEDGFYRVEHNGSGDDYYCTRVSFIRRVPLIILEVFVHSDVPERYRVVERMNSWQYISTKAFRLHFGTYELYWRYRIVPVGFSRPIWINVRLNANQRAFSPRKLKLNPGGEPVLFTSNGLISKLNKRIEVGLDRVTWSGLRNCPWENKFFYCNRSYGIFVDGRYRCRKHTIEDGIKVYPHDCPVQINYDPIGPLPKPDEIKTSYYYDGEKFVAEMTLYLVYEGGTLAIVDEMPERV